MCLLAFSVSSQLFLRFSLLRYAIIVESAGSGQRDPLQEVHGLVSATSRTTIHKASEHKYTLLVA